MHQTTQLTAATTASRSASAVAVVTSDSHGMSAYQSSDVLLSSLNDVDTLCSPSDMYGTGDLITDEDSSYRTLLDVSSDVICDKKSGSFIVDDLELFQ